MNLVVKSLIREFDVSKREIDELQNADENRMDYDLDDAQLNHELAELSKGIEVEDSKTVVEAGNSEEQDNIDGLVDEVAMLTDGERTNLEHSIRPVKLVLVKVQKISHTYHF